MLCGKRIRFPEVSRALQVTTGLATFVLTQMPLLGVLVGDDKKLAGELVPESITCGMNTTAAADLSWNTWVVAVLLISLTLLGVVACIAQHRWSNLRGRKGLHDTNDEVDTMPHMNQEYSLLGRVLLSFSIKVRWCKRFHILSRKRCHYTALQAALNMMCF